MLIVELLICQSDVIIEDLYQREGLYYAPGQDSVFSGNMSNWENGIKKLNIITRMVILMVKWSSWYNNGQPKEEIEYQLGVQNNVHKKWYYNGQQQYERTYKEGIHDGKWSSGMKMDR